MRCVFQGRFPNTKRAAALARRTLTERIAALGYCDEVLAGIETAAGEALANAAEHGHRPGSAIALRLCIDDDHLVIEVKDEGRGFSGHAQASGERPPSDAPRGFGIYLMRQFMDAIEYEERGTLVRLRKRLPAAQGAENESATG
jgi:anti-sigma regulatory factor (Ser/Thr protein kinase)